MSQCRHGVTNYFAVTVLTGFRRISRCCAGGLRNYRIPGMVAAYKSELAHLHYVRTLVSAYYQFEKLICRFCSFKEIVIGYVIIILQHSIVRNTVDFRPVTRACIDVIIAPIQFPTAGVSAGILRIVIGCCKGITADINRGRSGKNDETVRKVFGTPFCVRIAIYKVSVPFSAESRRTFKGGIARHFVFAADGKCGCRHQRKKHTKA